MGRQMGRNEDRGHGRRVLVVGIGPGDPEQLTIRAVRALNETDAVFIVDKGESAAELREARLRLCERVIDPAHPYRVVEAALDPVRARGDRPYGEAIAEWRHERVAAYERIVTGLGLDETGAFLVWGDPAYYDGTLAILDDVRANQKVEFTVEVIPGISSVSAHAARHGVALNRAGEPILVTTGRRLARDGVPNFVDNVVVMLDAHDAWRGLDDDFDVWWTAFAGMSGERSVAGKLGDQRDVIERERVRARAERGWLFDTFLFRRPR
jgi:precorrin-6A synthase